MAFAEGYKSIIGLLVFQILNSDWQMLKSKRKNTLPNSVWTFIIERIG